MDDKAALKRIRMTFIIGTLITFFSAFFLVWTTNNMPITPKKISFTTILGGCSDWTKMVNKIHSRVFLPHHSDLNNKSFKFHTQYDNYLLDHCAFVTLLNGNDYSLKGKVTKIIPNGNGQDLLYKSSHFELESGGSFDILPKHKEVAGTEIIINLEGMSFERTGYNRETINLDVITHLESEMFSPIPQMITFHVNAEYNLLDVSGPTNYVTQPFLDKNGNADGIFIKMASLPVNMSNNTSSVFSTKDPFSQKVSFSNKQKEFTEKGLIILFSTLLGIGVSALLEAYLSASIMTLQRSPRRKPRVKIRAERN